MQLQLHVCFCVQCVCSGCDCVLIATATDGRCLSSKTTRSGKRTAELHVETRDNAFERDVRPWWDKACLHVRVYCEVARFEERPLPRWKRGLEGQLTAS